MNAFLILDQISPKLRNILTVLLFFVGYVLQISSRNILIGLPFFIFCLLLNLIRGFSLKPIRATALEWKEVTPDKIEQVDKHCQRLKLIRGGNVGCVLFIIAIFFLLLFGIPLIATFVRSIESNFALIALIIDSLIIFGGLALSGRRSVWIPNNLDTKILIIKRILNHPLFAKDLSLKIIPYLEIGETKDGTYPNDTRILIKFKDVPEDFIGLQFQISINTVQSKIYPYCYCVIIARPTFGLFKKFKPVNLKGITIENERSDEADVIVIRQTTTKNSGYHTDQNVQDYILLSSIAIAKKILSA